MIKIYLLILISTGVLCAQTSLLDLNPVREKYANFEYREVIRTADSIILQETRYDTSARIELLTMKGIAHFTLKERNTANDTFLEILKLDAGHDMDTYKTPPKIAEFYNIIKKSYRSSREEQASDEMGAGVYIPVRAQHDNHSPALLKSIVFPGWGHSAYNKKIRGRVLMIGAILSLPPAIYYAFDTSGKEQDYLNEIDHDWIESRYQDYNTAYNYVMHSWLPTQHSGSIHRQTSCP